MGVGRAAVSPGWAQRVIPQQHQMATANLYQLQLLPFWFLSAVTEQTKNGTGMICWTFKANSPKHLKTHECWLPHRCFGGCFIESRYFWVSVTDSCVFCCFGNLLISKSNYSQQGALSDFKGWSICPTLCFPLGWVRIYIQFYRNL